MVSTWDGKAYQESVSAYVIKHVKVIKDTDGEDNKGKWVHEKD